MHEYMQTTSDNGIGPQHQQYIQTKHVNAHPTNTISGTPEAAACQA
jgi:hypothetical protein